MSGSRPQPKRSLCIVDDHVSVREALSAALEASGLFSSVIGVGSAEDAIALCRHSAPDLLILDTMLPGLSGIDAIRRLRRVSERTHILVYSGNVSPVLVGKAISSGAKGYLEKSASFRELLEGISTIMQGGTYFGPAVLPVFRDILTTPFPLDAGTRLSDKEKVIVSAIARGKTSKQISTELGRSVYTIENHRRRIMQKTGFKSVAQLTLFAAEQGWISSSDLGYRPDSAAPFDAKLATDSGLV